MRTRKQVGATAQLAPVAQKQLTLEGFSLYWLHGATKESVPSPSRRGWLGGRVSGAGDAKEPTFAAFDVISPLRVEAKLALNRMGVASQGAARIEAEVAVIGRAHVNVDCATMRDLSTLVCICGACACACACVCMFWCVRVCECLCAASHTRAITHTHTHTHRWTQRWRTRRGCDRRTRARLRGTPAHRASGGPMPFRSSSHATMSVCALVISCQNACVRPNAGCRVCDGFCLCPRTDGGPLRRY